MQVIISHVTLDSFQHNKMAHIVLHIAVMAMSNFVVFIFLIILLLLRQRLKTHISIVVLNADKKTLISSVEPINTTETCIIYSECQTCIIYSECRPQKQIAPHGNYCHHMEQFGRML